ncbi:hypothetical protein QCD60_30055 [Pokkaliibacter sp. MBI-7]|uniref:hypothetical protein n=1 Tax=Pokkaliibacter sp. MBI-7 TaxID=3040600 RepID=UPI002446F46A|nr:hypothetical protein [Pokkaliibacter sp. MBI-7]MDH2431064.1 hypothetical protein [Pokkaliibacter sp. MBI-7]MDH2436760.1 hypothetical protein [Pokkaliibacter sp. MBI-7]
MHLDIALYTALVSINVPEANARAVVDALGEAMSDQLATKADLALLEQKLERRIDQLDSKVDKLSLQLTFRLGSLLVVGIGIILTAMRYAPMQ